MYRIFPLLVCLLLIISCAKKKDNCGENYTLEAPAQVTEGETLTLTIAGFNNEINTYFAYDCPDMTPYTSTGPGGVEGSETFTIQNFGIQDEGTYTVTVFPGGDGCQSFTLSKTVTMIPKTCPCASPAATNTLYYSPSYESLFTEDAMTASVFNSGDETSSVITFSGQNTFKIFFGRMLPDFSSTYNLVGGINTFWDTFDDSYHDIHFHLDGYNHGFDWWYIEDGDSVYVERNGNLLSIQFCDVDVYHLGVYAFTINGKFVATV